MIQFLLKLSNQIILINRSYFIEINRSGEYQTVIKGYDTQISEETRDGNEYEPLFGEVYSNKSDYHQVFLNQNIIDTGSENEISPGSRR